jgi:hypothetical protein
MTSCRENRGSPHESDVRAGEPEKQLVNRGALTRSLRGVSELKKLAGEGDRLLEVDCERTLSICAQPQPPYVLALDVLDPCLWHRPQRYPSIPAQARRKSATGHGLSFR